MSDITFGQALKINKLEKAIERLKIASEDLKLLETQHVKTIEDTLTDGGIVINQAMPFQDYIDEVKLDINHCLTSIENEILAIRSSISTIKTEISEQIETEASDLSKADVSEQTKPEPQDSSKTDA